MGHESWVLWVVEFLTQEYNIIECDSSMEKGIERWPCNPRISGSIPGSGNLKKLFILMKIHMNVKDILSLSTMTVTELSINRVCQLTLTLVIIIMNR